MYFYLKSTIHCFTIWVLAALINAILSATCLSVAPNEFSNWGEALILTFSFTLAFSIPAVFIFWIIYMTSRMVNGNALFRLLLCSGFIGAVVSSVLFFISFSDMFKNYTFFLALSIIVAAVGSVMLHYNVISKNYKNKNYNNE
jgi:hypothetical protein